MSDVIKMHKYEDGNEAVVVKFGLGKIGTGLAPTSYGTLVVQLNELNKPKKLGAFLTPEEIEDNFKNAVNPLEVRLCFPDVKSVENFIETLKIYKMKAFYPNARTRKG